MKRSYKIWITCLFWSLTTCVFAQLQVHTNDKLIIELPKEEPGQAKLTSFLEPDNCVFSYMPVSSNTGHTSDSDEGWKCYQSFFNATGSFNLITIWGTTYPAVALPMEFIVEVYSPGIVPPTTLMSSTIVSAMPEITGEVVYGTPLYCYHLPISVSSLSSGWISVQSVAENSSVFYWLNTFKFPTHTAYQIGHSEIRNLETNCCYSYGLAMCLSNSNSVPVSPWVIIIGFVLIAGVVTFRFWRRMI